MLMELKSRDTDRAENNTRSTSTTHDEDAEHLSNKYFSFLTVKVYLSSS